MNIKLELQYSLKYNVTDGTDLNCHVGTQISSFTRFIWTNGFTRI